MRNAPFEREPGFYADAKLWLYGNVRLLRGNLDYVSLCLGPEAHSPGDLERIELQAEYMVLRGKTLVCGIHHEAHRRAAVVPLRWGAPRILVVSGGFRYHLGKDLQEEPFRAARLWRYQWDARTDLIISRRPPEKLPTYATHNPAVDRLIHSIAIQEVDALLFGP